MLQPVLVRSVGGDGESYELIAGERRWRAARRAGLQTIPVLAQSDAGDAQSLEQALVENLHREDLNPLEEAAAYQQLIDDFGFTHEQVAKRVGKSRAAVTNTLRLLQLPSGVQRALADGDHHAGPRPGAARAPPTEPSRSPWWRRIIAEGLTVRAVEDEVRTIQDRLPARKTEAGTTDGSDQPADGPRPLPEPGLLELEELLPPFLNTRVKVELKNRGAGWWWSSPPSRIWSGSTGRWWGQPASSRPPSDRWPGPITRLDARPSRPLNPRWWRTRTLDSIQLLPQPVHDVVDC